MEGEGCERRECAEVDIYVRTSIDYAINLIKDLSGAEGWGGGGDGCFGMCTAPWTRTCTFCCVLTTVKHREGESQGATATWRGCTHKPSTQPTPEIHAQLINAIASFKYGVTRWFIGHHNIGLACFSLTPHTLLHPTPAHTFHT